MGGFDTHANQPRQHANLLTELAEGLSTFYSDLAAQGRANDVVTMTFSEFGRRVKENGSAGTDHGAASVLFLAGGAVKGGVYGDYPSLSDLDDGDLRMHTDFRSVYATLLDKWLATPSQPVLDGSFPHLISCSRTAIKAGLDAPAFSPFSNIMFIAFCFISCTSGMAQRDRFRAVGSDCKIRLASYEPI